MRNQVSEHHDSDVDRYLAQDKLVDARFSRLTRQISLGGLALAAMIVIFENAFIGAKVDLTQGVESIVPQLRQAFTYGVDPTLGVTVAVGLLTAVATLAVAVVAATWRPVGLDLEIEVSVSRAVSAFVNAGRAAAALTMALAILVLPNLGVFAVSGMIALVSVLISIAVQDRQDARDGAVRLAYRRQYVEAADARSERLAREYVWTRTRPHGYRTVLLYFLAPWLALLLLVATTFVINAFVGAEWGEAASAALVSFVIGAISSTFATMAAGFTVIAVRSRWGGDVRLEAIMYRALAVVSASIPLVFVVFVSRSTEQLPTGLLELPTGLLLAIPLAAWLTLLQVGRHGKGPGACPWTGAAQALARQAKDARHRMLEHETHLGPTGALPGEGQPQPLPNEPSDSLERAATLLVAAATAVLIWRFASHPRR